MTTDKVNSFIAPNHGQGHRAQSIIIIKVLRLPR